MLPNYQATSLSLHSWLFNNTLTQLFPYKIDRTQNQTFYQNLGEFY